MATNGQTRCYNAMILVWDVYPEMLRDMIVNQYPPHIVAEKIEKDGRFKGKRSADERKAIATLKTLQYSNCDGPLMYTMIRYFELVNQPTRGWGRKPIAGDENVGDDVERLRSIRNFVIHRPQALLTETEYEKVFTESSACAERLDNILGRQENGFKDNIARIKGTALDTTMVEKYEKLLDEHIGMKERAMFVEDNENNCIKLYYGKDIMNWIGNINHKGDESTPCTIYCSDSTMQDKGSLIRFLDHIKEELNNGNCHIKLLSVDNGSVILYISIINNTFASSEILHDRLRLFINTIVKQDRSEDATSRYLQVILTETDYSISQEISHSLKCGNVDCGLEIAKSANFCSTCGTPVRGGHCSVCNAIISYGHNFCAECGHQISLKITEVDKVKRIYGNSDSDSDVFQAQTAVTGKYTSNFTDDLEKLKNKFNEEGREQFTQFCDAYLNKWKKQHVKFGITGASRTGKSSFINAFTGCRKGDPEFAKTSVFGDTTDEPKYYQHPRNKSFVLCDLPGVGTVNFPWDEYVEQMELSNFDYFLIFFEVVLENDVWLANQLQKMGKSFCFVRAKLDIDEQCASNDEMQVQDYRTLAVKISEKACTDLAQMGLRDVSVFVISNKVKTMGQFHSLIGHMAKTLDTWKYEAILYSITSLTEPIIRRKYQSLVKRLSVVSMAAIIFSMRHGATEDGTMSSRIIQYIIDEIQHYINTFELDNPSIQEAMDSPEIKSKLKLRQILKPPFGEHILKYVQRYFGDIEVLKDLSFVSKILTIPHIATTAQSLLFSILEALRDDSVLVFKQLGTIQ